MLSESEFVTEEARARDRVCLCVIFNHPYLRNIPVLRKLYSERFFAVRFLVPLALSDDDDVITVYRGSFAHNAYAVDAKYHLETIDCDYFLFIHDDVLLAPWIDQSNLLDILGIQGPDEGFLEMVRSVPSDVGEWGYQTGSLWKLLFPSQ